MRRPRGRGVSAAVILLLTLGGCSSTGPWKQQDVATPWIAPGERALAFYRTVDHFGGTNTSERVWRDSEGRDHVVYDIQDEIEEFLHESGIMAQWPESQAGNMRGRMRLAPFRFTVVAVNPTVVLMSPFDFGSPKGRSTSDILEPIGDRRCLGNGYMINPLECDITAPFAPKMLWFSHDLKKSPAPIDWKGGRAEIDLENGERLTLTRDDATVRTERTSSGRSSG